MRVRFIARPGAELGMVRARSAGGDAVTAGPPRDVPPPLRSDEALRYGPGNHEAATGQEVHGEMAVNVDASAPWTG